MTGPMSGRIATLSAQILRLSRFTAPNHRRIWIAAMIAEREFIPPEQQLPFALGCLRCAVHERIRDMITRKDIFFLPAVIGSILMALLCLTGGIRLMQEAPIVAGTLLATTFIWAAMAGAFLFRTRSRVAHMGLGGLAFYAAVGILALSASFMPLAFAENAEFFRAFALEGVALTLGVLGVAWFAPLWRDAAADSE